MKPSVGWWWGAACAATLQVLAAATPGTPGGTGDYRDFKVIKSYLAQDEDYTFRAFVIAWDEQQVVAMDAGALINARSDDTINVLVSRGRPEPRQNAGRIVFLARPEKKPPGGEHFPTPANTAVVAQLRVNKVYALTDSEHTFRAYEVQWKGQDVIVFTWGREPTYDVGDTVTIMVLKAIYQNHGKTHGVLSFLLQR